MNNLTVDGEFRYIVQWFNEWSELQRADFVPIMVEYLLQGTTNVVYINGISNSVYSVGLSDRPMSLFQCRIKLFREWSSKWPMELKEKLKEKIMEMDPIVGEKIMNEIMGQNVGHTKLNGLLDVVNDDDNEDDNADDDVCENAILNAAIAIVEDTEAAINTDDRLALILNEETATDDVKDEPQIVETHVEPAQQVEPQAQQHQQKINANPVAQTISMNAEVPLVA